MRHYFPLKRVLAMIVIIMVNTISWVSTLQQPANDYISTHFPILKTGVNWLAIISGLVFFAIVLWTLWDLSKKIMKTEETRPNIKWFENHESPLYANVTTETVKKGDYLCNVLQIWFKNQPVVPTDDSVAKDVTAMVTFYNRDSKNTIPVAGCFIIAEAHDYAGNTGLREETIDKWAPNDEPHKLQIAIKRQEEDSAFGYGMGTDITAKEIKKGKYYVQVDIKGTRVVGLQPFWFALDNQGSGKELSLSQQIKKPDLRREGFLT